MRTSIATGAKHFGIRSTFAALALLTGMLALPRTAPAKKIKGVIEIGAGDVTKLEETVNNPKYENYRILLAPGTYTLTSALILQRDMDLIGSQEWDSMDENGVPEAVTPGTETIIDASDVTTGLFVPAIQAGSNNHIERLTLRRSSPTGLSPIIGPSPYIEYEGWQFVMSDCVIDLQDPGAIRGLQITTWPFNSGTDSITTITRNILRAPSASGAVLVDLSFAGQGTTDNPPNPIKVENAKQLVIFTNNRMDGGLSGLWAQGANNAYHCRLKIVSTRNVFENASFIGIIVNGGLYSAALGSGDQGSDFNDIVFTSTEDIIRNNGANGITLVGGNSLSKPTVHSPDYNTVTAFFLGTEFLNNGPAENPNDITALGQASPNRLPWDDPYKTTGNIVNIFMQDVNPPFMTVTSDPENENIVNQGVWEPFQ